MSSVGNNAEIS